MSQAVLSIGVLASSTSSEAAKESLAQRRYYALVCSIFCLHIIILSLPLHASHLRLQVLPQHRALCSNSLFG